MTETVVPDRTEAGRAHALGDVGENEIGRDRRPLVEACLAKLALDIDLLGEAEAPMRLQASLG